MKQNATDLKGDWDKSTCIVGDFNAIPSRVTELLERNTQGYGSEQPWTIMIESTFIEPQISNVS